MKVGALRNYFQSSFDQSLLNYGVFHQSAEITAYIFSLMKFLALGPSDITR